MACATLQSSIQDLATKRCFVSHFETQLTVPVTERPVAASRELHAALQQYARKTPHPRAPALATPERGSSGERGKWRSRPISRVLSWTVIPLGASSPIRSSNLPGPDAGSAIRSLFGLAPGGVCHAGLLPDSRCALTAPFHPCHASSTLSNTRPFGGLLSVALSVGSRRPGVTWHRALWSPDFPRHRDGMLRCDDATVWPTPPRAVYRLPGVCGRRMSVATAVQRLAGGAAEFGGQLGRG